MKGDMDMKLKLLSLFPFALLFALMLAPTTGATENDVYAILYSDKTLVFQYGDAPESGREVTETYPVDLNGYNSWNYQVPWSDKSSTIKTVIFKDAIQPLSMAYWFNGFSALKSIQDLDKVDTSYVTSMAYLFAGCSKFESMDLRGLDTSSVTSMKWMFSGCNRLTSLNISGWDTSRVTDMGSLFFECSKLKTLNISGFNTSNVTDMGGMFSRCSSLTALDVSDFDTSKVMTMNGMFNSCSTLTALDVSSFDTSNVTGMSGMFNRCSSLTALDVSGFDTSKVTDMNNMFSSCYALTALDVRGFDTSNVTTMAGMFCGCSKLQTLDVGGWDTSKVTDMHRMFGDDSVETCASLTTLDVSGWDTSQVTVMDSMFRGCSKLTTLDVSGWNTSEVMDMDAVFEGCASLTTLDVSNWDTSNATDYLYSLHYMFARCFLLKTIYASEYFLSDNLADNIKWNGMFENCRSLVGGAGTRYDEAHKDAEYARIDSPPDAPGYFTYKEPSAHTTRTPVTLTLKLRDSSGKAVTMDDMRKGAEIAPEITVEDDAPESELKTADIFLVIYDSQGMMLSLQQWEVDLSNPLSFIRTTPIPQGRDASSVKFIMLSSDLTPLTVAQALQ